MNSYHHTESDSSDVRQRQNGDLCTHTSVIRSSDSDEIKRKYLETQKLNDFYKDQIDFLTQQLNIVVEVAPPEGSRAVEWQEGSGRILRIVRSNLTTKDQEVKLKKFSETVSSLQKQLLRAKSTEDKMQELILTTNEKLSAKDLVIKKLKSENSKAFAETKNYQEKLTLSEKDRNMNRENLSNLEAKCRKLETSIKEVKCDVCNKTSATRKFEIKVKEASQSHNNNQISNGDVLLQAEIKKLIKKSLDLKKKLSETNTELTHNKKMIVQLEENNANLKQHTEVLTTEADNKTKENEAKLLHMMHGINKLKDDLRVANITKEKYFSDLLESFSTQKQLQIEIERLTRINQELQDDLDKKKKKVVRFEKIQLTPVTKRADKTSTISIRDSSSDIKNDNTKNREKTDSLKHTIKALQASNIHLDTELEQSKGISREKYLTIERSTMTNKQPTSPKIALPATYVKENISSACGNFYNEEATGIRSRTNVQQAKEENIEVATGFVQVEQSEHALEEMKKKNDKIEKQHLSLKQQKLQDASGKQKQKVVRSEKIQMTSATKQADKTSSISIRGTSSELKNENAISLEDIESLKHTIKAFRASDILFDTELKQSKEISRKKDLIIESRTNVQQAKEENTEVATGFVQVEQSELALEEMKKKKDEIEKQHLSLKQQKLQDASDQRKQKVVRSEKIQMTSATKQADKTSTISITDTSSDMKNETTINLEDIESLKQSIKAFRASDILFDTELKQSKEISKKKDLIIERLHIKNKQPRSPKISLLPATYVTQNISSTSGNFYNVEATSNKLRTNVQQSKEENTEAVTGLVQVQQSACALEEMKKKNDEIEKQHLSLKLQKLQDASGKQKQKVVKSEKIQMASATKQADKTSTIFIRDSSSDINYENYKNREDIESLKHTIKALQASNILLDTELAQSKEISKKKDLIIERLTMKNKQPTSPKIALQATYVTENISSSSGNFYNEETTSIKIRTNVQQSKEENTEVATGLVLVQQSEHALEEMKKKKDEKEKQHLSLKRQKLQDASGKQKQKVVKSEKIQMASATKQADKTSTIFIRDTTSSDMKNENAINLENIESLKHTIKALQASIIHLDTELAQLKDISRKKDLTIERLTMKNKQPTSPKIALPATYVTQNISLPSGNFYNVEATSNKIRTNVQQAKEENTEVATGLVQVQQSACALEEMKKKKDEIEKQHLSLKQQKLQDASGKQKQKVLRSEKIQMTSATKHADKTSTISIRDSSSDTNNKNTKNCEENESLKHTIKALQASNIHLDTELAQSKEISKKKDLIIERLTLKNKQPSSPEIALPATYVTQNISSSSGNFYNVEATSNKMRTNVQQSKEENTEVATGFVQLQQSEHTLKEMKKKEHELEKQSLILKQQKLQDASGKQKQKVLRSEEIQMASATKHADKTSTIFIRDSSSDITNESYKNREDIESLKHTIKTLQASNILLDTELAQSKEISRKKDLITERSTMKNKQPTSPKIALQATYVMENISSSSGNFYNVETTSIRNCTNVQQAKEENTEVATGLVLVEQNEHALEEMKKKKDEIEKQHLSLKRQKLQDASGKQKQKVVRSEKIEMTPTTKQADKTSTISIRDSFSDMKNENTINLENIESLKDTIKAMRASIIHLDTELAQSKEISKKKDLIIERLHMRNKQPRSSEIALPATYVTENISSSSGNFYNVETTSINSHSDVQQAKDENSKAATGFVQMEQSKYALEEMKKKTYVTEKQNLMLKQQVERLKKQNNASLQDAKSRIIELENEIEQLKICVTDRIKFDEVMSANEKLQSTLIEKEKQIKALQVTINTLKEQITKFKEYRTSSSLRNKVKNMQKKHSVTILPSGDDGEEDETTSSSECNKKLEERLKTLETLQTSHGYGQDEVESMQKALTTLFGEKRQLEQDLHNLLQQKGKWEETEAKLNKKITTLQAVVEEMSLPDFRRQPSSQHGEDDTPYNNLAAENALLKEKIRDLNVQLETKIIKRNVELSNLNQSQLVQKELLKAKEKKSVYTETKLKDFQQQRSESRSSSRSIDFQQDYEKQHLKKQGRILEEKNRVLENLEAVKDVTFDCALCAEIEKENKELREEMNRLRTDLSHYDGYCFNEVDDLRYNYSESVKLNVLYEDQLRELSQKYGVPICLRVDEYNGDKKNKESTHYTTLKSLSVGEKQLEQDCQDLLQQKRKWKETEAKLNKKIITLQAVVEEMSLPEFRRQPSSQHGEDDTPYNNLAAENALLKEKIRDLNVQLETKIIKRNVELSNLNQSQPVQEELIKEKEEKLLYTETKLKDFQQQRSESRSSSRSIDFQQDYEKQHLKKQGRILEEKNRVLENLEAVKDVTFDCALCTEIEKENKELREEMDRLRSDLSHYDGYCFNEVDDLRYNYSESVKLNVLYEDQLRELSQKYGVPICIRVDEYDGDKKNKESTHYTTLKSLSVGEKQLEQDCQDLLQEKREWKEAEAKLNKKITTLQAVIEEMSLPEFRRQPSSQHGEDDTPYNNLAAENALLKEKIHELNVQLKTEKIKRNVELSNLNRLQHSLKELLKEKEEKLLYTETKLKDFQQHLSEYRSSSRSIDFQQYFEMQHLKKQEKHRILENLEAVKDVTFDCALCAEIEKENKELREEMNRLRTDLSHYDGYCFNEVDDLRYNYSESVKLNVLYEDQLRELSQKYGVPICLRVDEYDGDEKTKDGASVMQIDGKKQQPK
ncbi:uncharacterized protein LOC143446922 isoform X2 [Clavelina lepadiformis]